MKWYSPVHAASCIPRIWSSVDLPAPDGPMMDTNSPGLISTVIRRSTYVWPGPAGNAFSMPLVEMSGALAGSAVASGTADSDDERLNNTVVLLLVGTDRLGRLTVAARRARDLAAYLRSCQTVSSITPLPTLTSGRHLSSGRCACEPCCRSRPTMLTSSAYTSHLSV